MADFCEVCGVTMDLHDLSESDPCGHAEAQADRLERIERLFWSVVTR